MPEDMLDRTPVHALLADGTTMRIRPVTPADLPARAVRARWHRHRGPRRPRRPACAPHRPGRPRLDHRAALRPAAVRRPRGAPADLEGLERLLLRLSRMAADLPQLAEVDFDPVLAAPAGVSVLDARVRLVPRRPHDPYLRRLR